MKNQLALAALLALAGSAFAQATVKDDGQWRAAMGLSASASSGNTKSTNFSLVSDAVKATKQDKWALYANALYGKADGVTSANQIRLGTKYDWNLSAQLYAFGAAEAERDSPANLSSRLTLGGGMGYRIINTDPLKFEVFGGVGHVSEHYKGVDSKNHMTLILGEESIHKLGQSTTAKQRLVMYPSLKSGGGYRAQWDAGISVAATSSMNLTAGVSVKTNSKPNQGNKKTDTLFTTGVSFKFE